MKEHGQVVKGTQEEFKGLAFCQSSKQRRSCRHSLGVCYGGLKLLVAEILLHCLGLLPLVLDRHAAGPVRRRQAASAQWVRYKGDGPLRLMLRCSQATSQGSICKEVATYWEEELVAAEGCSATGTGLATGFCRSLLEARTTADRLCAAFAGFTA